MRRVTGLGGVFFKTSDPQKMYEWYDRHLGIKKGEHGVSFLWRDAEDTKKIGMTAWALFPRDTKYFDPKREDYDYGRFAWIMDPEGNRIELWQPIEPAAKPKKAVPSSQRKVAKKSPQAKKARKKS